MCSWVICHSNLLYLSHVLLSIASIDLWVVFAVSKRSSRSYSHQTFVQYTPKGVFGYRTQTYSHTDHFYTPNNMNYYQPNQYHYHSTPWRYRCFLFLVANSNSGFKVGPSLSQSLSQSRHTLTCTCTLYDSEFSLPTQSQLEALLP